MGMPRSSFESGSAIRESWAELNRARPGLRQRDAADLLGVSEGALVAGRVGDGVCQLRPDWPLLLRALAGLGPVKTITRNAWAVHETIGVYEKVSFVGNIGLVQSEGLDLRLLLDRWKSGFVVSDRTPSGLRHSLQFFDEKGEAVHKIYPEGDVDLPTFTSLLSRFACTGDVDVAATAGATASATATTGAARDEVPGRGAPPGGAGGGG
jgi:putative hemin transport protein